MCFALFSQHTEASVAVTDLKFSIGREHTEFAVEMPKIALWAREITYSDILQF